MLSAAADRMLRGRHAQNVQPDPIARCTKVTPEDHCMPDPITHCTKVTPDHHCERQATERREENPKMTSPLDLGVRNDILRPYKHKPQEQRLTHLNNQIPRSLQPRIITATTV